MNSRERLSLAIGGKQPDRVPKLDISYWPETVARWEREGLPTYSERDGASEVQAGSAQNDFYEEYFGLDKTRHFHYDSTLGLEERTLYEDDEKREFTDQSGVVYREYKKVYFPRTQLGTLLNSREAWEEHKDCLSADATRFSEDMDEAYQSADAEGDRYKILRPIEPIWEALRILGEENAMYKIVEEPDLLGDIVERYTEFNLDMLEELLGKGYSFDAVWFFSDLCYKNGMLFSPAFYREIVMPHHKRLFAFCKDKGMQILYHCCGYVATILPLLIESGINCIQPMEVRAGNDVRVYKELYGGAVSFMGNIGVDAMAAGGKTLEDEVGGKMTAAKLGGGYIYHCDHSVPPSVSLKNYLRTLELADRYGRYDG